MGNTILENLLMENESDPTAKLNFRDPDTTELVIEIYNMKPCEVGDNLGMLVEWMRQAEDKMSKCVRYMHTKQGMSHGEIAKELGMEEEEVKLLMVADRPEVKDSSDEEEENDEDSDDSEESEEKDEEETDDKQGEQESDEEGNGGVPAKRQRHSKD